MMGRWLETLRVKTEAKAELEQRLKEGEPPEGAAAGAGVPAEAVGTAAGETVSLLPGGVAAGEAAGGETGPR